MLPLDVAGTNADIIMAQLFYHDNFSTLLNWSTTVLTQTGARRLLRLR